jgi:hypothetical protein
MGLKSAGSYFQRVMTTVVLAGLLYIICELYLDNILVYGADENDLYLISARYSSSFADTK